MGSDEPASILPAGTVTFLLTELDPASAVWQASPDLAVQVLKRHFELIDAAVAVHGGVRRQAQAQADEALAVFASASDAVTAALEVHRAMVAEAWPGQLRPRLRIAVHTGEAQLRDSRAYTGAALGRCVRLRDVAHAGQTVVSSVTAAIVADALPPGAWLSDLGEHRLRDLSRPEQVFELRHPDVTGDFPPLQSLDALATNLPVQLTSFVGRSDELAAVELLMAGERLVTLTGAGGCGKTRLAMQAAAELADRWVDGVWWVDLAPVTDPSLVAEVVASACRVPVDPVADPLRALALQHRDRAVLVCVDNCEHLLEACAELVETLLRWCPRLSVLATGREPLGVPGETVWRVPPLADEDAVSLFMDRASRVRPWFTLDGTNETAVRTLCRRLDGMPLAIELAAAWLRTLTPAQIAAGLDDRFALLVRGPRGAIARQQTLAASIDWSHDLLEDTDRIVFRRLAVFAGGFGLDAARAVCAADPIAADDVLAPLGRLVDKSLVLMEENAGEARYRLLETIREYANDRLEEAKETEATRHRHLAHYLDLAETAEPELERADRDVWLPRLEIERDNLRAALHWSWSVGEGERFRRLAAALAWLWNLNGPNHEGVAFLQQAIELAPDDRSTLQAKLWTALALVADTGGPLRLELEAAQRGLEIATANGDDRYRGRCLLLAAVVQVYIDPDVAWELCEQAEHCAEAVNDAFIADSVMVLRGIAMVTRDQHEAASQFLLEGIERCLRRGDRGFAATGMAYRIDTAVRTGDVPLAIRRAEEVVRIGAPVGDYYTAGGATAHLAWVKGVAGDVGTGLRLMGPVVRAVEGADHDVYVPRLAPVLGKLHLWAGQLEEAVAWFERDAYATDPQPDSLIVARSLPGLGTALRRLGRLEEAERVIDRAIGLSRQVDAPHLLAEALEQAGHLALAAGDPDRAEDHHHQALALRVRHGLRTFYVDSLDALAELAARAESFTEAVRLLAASDVARTAMGYPRPSVDQPDHEATVATLRAALGEDAFAATWSEGSALSLDDAVAYVRRARGTRGRPSSGWASLTPTEIDVVRLVVEGLTNPEIGSRLFMSRATVKTHLSHVYAKLGVANRIELTALASSQMPEP